MLDHLVDLALVFGEAFERASEFLATQCLASSSAATERLEQFGRHFVDRDSARAGAADLARILGLACAARTAGCADFIRRARGSLAARERSLTLPGLFASPSLTLGAGLAGFGSSLFAMLGLALGSGLLLRAGLAGFGAGPLLRAGLTGFGAGPLLRAGLAGFGSGLLLRAGLAGFSSSLFASLGLTFGAGLLLRTRLARVGSRALGGLGRIAGFAGAFRRFGGLGSLLGLAATRFALRRSSGFFLGGFCRLALGLRSLL